MVLDVGVGCFRFFNIFKKQLTIMEDNFLRISEDSWAARRQLLLTHIFLPFFPYFNNVGPMHFSFLSFQILFLLFLSFPITYFPFFLADNFYFSTFSPIHSNMSPFPFLLITFSLSISLSDTCERMNQKKENSKR
jgi:hypothetical protein